MDALELSKYFVLEKQNVRSGSRIPFFPNETESQDVRLAQVAPRIRGRGNLFTVEILLSLLAKKQEKIKLI